MSKVLVLGAGASMAYGYPSGWGLRQRILDLDPMTASESGIVDEWRAQSPDNRLTQFQKAFRESSFYSIDAFLARRTEFAEIGKQCIAHVLLSCERRGMLFSEEKDKDHWYQYFINQYLKVDWDDLDFSNISFVTFNYDRSLEHFLLWTLQAAYGKHQAQVIEKLKTLNIVHVYGTIGASYPNDSGTYRSYDQSIVDSYWNNIAAGSIHVIPEGRESNAAEFERARNLLEKADRICFLGFGFDAINVERLTEGEACGIWKFKPSGHTARGITGTCLGLTNAESQEAWRKLTYQEKSYGPRDSRLQPHTCTQHLRETLFLT